MERMPHDVLKEVFDFLDPIELFIVSMVCKAWNKVSSEDTIWMKWTSDFKVKYFQWLKHQAEKYASSGRPTSWMIPDNATNVSLKDRHDYMLKLLLVGDSGVGKSSILLRFTDDIFHSCLMSTIGVDFKLKDIKLNGNSILLQIWDRPGGEFRHISPIYYRGACGIVFVYDVSDRLSFENLQYWIGEVEKFAAVTGSAEKFLVGNKTDLNRVVSVDEAKELAAARGYHYFEVSAKTGLNVSETFLDIAKTILPDLLPLPRPPSRQLFLQRIKRVKVQEQPKKKEEKKDWCVVS